MVAHNVAGKALPGIVPGYNRLAAVAAVVAAVARIVPAAHLSSPRAGAVSPFRSKQNRTW